MPVDRRFLVLAVALVAMAGAFSLACSSGGGPKGGTASTTISSSGGELRTADGVKLSVPADAFSAPAQATISRVDSPPGQGQAVRVHGPAYEIKVGDLQPAKPLTVAIPLKGLLAPESAFVVTFDEATQRWLIVGGDYDPVAGVVRAEVSHLTKFSLADLDPNKLLGDLGERMQAFAREADQTRVLAALAKFVDSPLDPLAWIEAFKHATRPCNSGSAAVSASRPKEVGLVGCVRESKGAVELSVVNLNPYWVSVTASGKLGGYPSDHVLGVGEELSWQAGDTNRWSTLTVTSDVSRTAAVLMFTDVALGFVLKTIDRPSVEKYGSKFVACVASHDSARKVFAALLDQLQGKKPVDNVVEQVLGVWSDPAFATELEDCVTKVGFDAFKDVPKALGAKAMAKAISKAMLVGEVWKATVRVGSMMAAVFDGSSADSVEFVHSETSRPDFTVNCFPLGSGSLHCQVQPQQYKVEADSYKWSAPGSKNPSASGSQAELTYPSPGEYTVSVSGCKGALCSERATRVAPWGASSAASPSPSPSPPPEKSVRDVDWLNREYRIPGSDENVRVQAGQYSTSGQCCARVLKAVVQPPVFADLTGDGRDEAIVVMQWNNGGNFWSSTVVTFTMRDGSPVALGDIGVGTDMDGFVRSVVAQAPYLVATRTHRVDGDSHAAGPTHVRTEFWRWDGARFVEDVAKRVVKAIATPTATPTTAVGRIQPVLDALAAHDAGRLKELIRYTDVKCITKANGLDPAPFCPAGVAAGTVVQGFPVGNCEGRYLLPTEVDALALPGVDAQLYGVLRLPAGASPSWLPPAAYELIWDRAGFGGFFGLDGDGRLLDAFFGCARTPAQVAQDMLAKGATWLLPPR